MHCQVQVTGPDSKGLKSKYNAFHTFKNGRTTLSCSGLLLLSVSATAVGAGADAAAAASSAASSTCLVLAPVTCLYPFIQSHRRHKLASAAANDLLPSVEISVLADLSELTHQVSSSSSSLAPHSSNSSSSSKPSRAPAVLPVRLPAKLLTVLELPGVHAAAEQLLESTNSAAAAGDWKLGWCLADRQPLAAAPPAILGHVAALQVDLQPVLQSPAVRLQANRLAPCCTHGPKAAACDSSSSSSSNSSSSRRLVGCAAVYQGQPVTVTGSPFGCLAEQQFFGAVVTGCISLLLPAANQTSSSSAAAAAAGPSLFLVDGRCMPGMEGGPIRCRSCGALLGVLGVPLSNSSSQAELLLGISIRHLTAALTAAAAAAAAAAADKAQLLRLATALQHVSCSCCCGGGGSSHIAAESACCSSGSSSSGSSSSLQRCPAAAHNASWQQPAQLLTEQHLQPRRQQQHQLGQLAQHSADSSSSSSSKQTVTRDAASVRRLHVHLQQLLPSGAGCCSLDEQQQQQQQQQQQHAIRPADTAACALPPVGVGAGPAATLSSHAAGTTVSSSSSSSTGWSGLPPSAASGVVMVRVGRSWGSGVLITQSGIVLTVAHLFRKSNAAQAASAAAAAAAGGVAGPSAGIGKPSSSSSSSSSNSGLAAQEQAANSRYPGQQRLYPIPPQHLQDSPADVSIRLTLPPSASASSSSSSSSSRDVWVPAKVLYYFTGYLDLAVLQIQQQGFRDPKPNMLQPLQLVPERCDVTPGDDMYVIGHGLFGPRMGLGPAVTAGCVARVVAVPISSSSSSSSSRHVSGPQQQQQWKLSMVISTAAVHSGASGGALVDAAGRLVGLVTSNARHVKGQTLPHLNFCISAAELRPVWDWAQQQQQQQQLVLKGFDVHSVSGSRLWALQPYMHMTAVASSL